MGMMQKICSQGLGFGARLQSRVSLLSISYEEEFAPMNVSSGMIEPAAMCDFSPMLELAPILMRPKYMEVFLSAAKGRQIQRSRCTLSPMSRRSYSPRVVPFSIVTPFPSLAPSRRR